MNDPSWPTLIALDTSTQEMSLAVQVGAVTRTWQGPGGAEASGHLLKQICELLTQCGGSLQSVHAVAFGAGPGAFTGLRTAASVAQGLALGADAQVIPVDSLMVVAEAAWLEAVPPEPTGPQELLTQVGVVMDARMGEVYVGRYGRADDAWQVVRAPALCDPADVAAHWGGSEGWPAWVTGSGVSMLDVPSTVQVVQARDRAAALLRLAQRGLAQGRGIDPAQALPLYLRDQVALTTAQRQAVAALGPSGTPRSAQG